MSLNMQPSTQSPGKDAYFTKDNTYMRSSLTKSVTQNTQQATIKKAHPFSNQQSPFSHSPNPYASKLNYSLSASNDELDLYKLKCSDLEHQLNALRGELEVQRVVSLKTNDLEGRVGDVVVHNQHLQGQLDKATKHAIQRKTEADLWKQKYETQMSQLVQIKANYELEIKALSQELQKIHAHLGTMETDKNRTISDAKTITESQKYAQIETIKSSQNNQVEMYEAQLKKLRDIIEDKSVQVSQLQTVLERQKAEYNDMQARLRNEVEAIKNRLSSIQIDHQKELESLKAKLDLYKDTQVRNAQHAHDNQTDMFISEIEKLKHLLEIKNEEIETLLQQNQKQKNAYDLEGHALREEINDMKEKLLHNEKTHQQENHNIQANLERMHNQEITSLKLQHEKQVQLLNQEILKLKDIINGKNLEIEKQIVEKAQQKDYYDGEIERLVTTIEEWKRKYALLEAERNREISDLLQRIDRLNEQAKDRERQLQAQLDLLDQEIRNLKDLLNHKQKEIEKNQATFSQIKLDLEDQIRALKDELELVKLRAYETEKAKNQEIQDLKLALKELDQNARERQKQLEVQIDHLHYELNKARDMYTNKTKECENLHAQRLAVEAQIRKLIEENDYLVQKLHAFEKEKNLEIDELRAKMDSGAAYQFENLKKAYNTQVGILSDQIADLQNRLDQKQREYTEILEKYSILDKAVLPEQLVAQNMYNSRTGVPAEFVANKAVHDMLVKSTIRQGSNVRKPY